MVLAPLDYIIAGIAVFTTVVGLFRGFSGEIGALGGLIAAVVALGFLYPVAMSLAQLMGMGAATAIPTRIVACILDGLFALVAYGLARKVISKTISFLVPQPANALIGACLGLGRALVIVLLLLVIDYVQSGCCAMGFPAEHSEIVRFLGTLADMYVI